MSSIDDRVVNMQFNNAQFQKGITETNNSISDLKQNLKLDNATQGIDQVQKASDKFSLDGIGRAVDNIQSKFSVFGAAAFTVVSRLTNAALDAGKNIAGGLLDPLVQGGAKRALALQQANFQFRGLGLDIEATMAAALAAVKGTAFGLDDAALAAGQFGASGITAGHGLEVSLRAVSGVAAQTGSSYESVAQIFEKVAGNGRLMGDDLLSLSSRGVNAAATLAKSMGISESAVRDMVSDGKISFKQFSEAMNDAFGANAAKANETYTGALANMRAALSRIGAEVAGPYFTGLRDIFNALGPLFDKIHLALMPLINDFNGFQASGAADAVFAITRLLGPGLVASIVNIVNAIRKIGAAIGGGFREIFPSDTVAILSNISRFLQNVTESLIPTAEEADNLRRIFAGVFAIFSIAGQIIGPFIAMLFNLFGVVGQGTGGFLAFVANIGDFIVRIDFALRQSKPFIAFFGLLTDAVKVPIKVLQDFFGVLGDGIVLLTHLNPKGLTDFGDAVSERFSGLIQLGQFLMKFWDGVIKVATFVWTFLNPVFSAIGDAVREAVGKIFDALSGLSFDDALKVVNTGIFAGFLFIVNGFFGNLQGALQGNGVAFVTKFKLIFGQLQLNLKALEVNTNAKTLTQIAIAVALLAASAVALSLVDPVRLGAALAALGGLMYALLTAFKSFAALDTKAGVFKIVAMSIALQVIAGAIFTLAIAVAILGALPIQNVVQGFIAVALLLQVLTTVLERLAKVGPSVLYAAGAIAIIAPAIAILAGSVAILGAIPIDNLVQGLLGFAAVIGIMVIALKLLAESGPEILFAAGAIAILAPGLAILAGIIALLGALPLNNITQGLIAFVVVVGVLVGALLLLGILETSVIGSAIALALIANSITQLVGVVALLGAMDMGQLIQGLIALVIVLAVIVGAVLLLGFAAEPALAGAAALLIVAFAIGIIAPAIAILGSLSWDDIGRAITVLAAAILILAVGGILLIPASVGFLAMGVALLLIGTGVFLAATGIALLAGAIGLLVLVGYAGIQLFTLALQQFIAMLPQLAVGIGNAFVAFAVTVGEKAPQLINAFVQVLLAMLSAVDQVVPELLIVATDIIVGLIDALVILVPDLINAGLTIFLAFLQGISDNIQKIVELGYQIMINFLNGIANKLPDLIAASGNVVLAFITGIGDYIRNNSAKFVDAGSKLFRAIVDGISLAITTGGGDLRYAGQKIGNALIEGAKKALGINSPSKVFRDNIMPSVFEGIENGNDKNISRAEDSGTAIGDAITTGAVASVKNAIAGINDAFDANVSAPTIRPVLDLTDIQSGAALIPGMIPTPSLSMDTSNDVATSVSLQEKERNAAIVLDKSNVPSSDPSVTFIQNNNSPKALSPTEVYRNTQNQLSVLKGDLGVVDQSGSS